MYSPKITSDSLRKKLQDLGLREDNDGYWYYDSFNTGDWMIASYEDKVRISTEVSVDKNGNGYFEGLGDVLDCVNEEEILEQVNKILKQVKRLELTRKKKKMKMRMNKLKKDFK